MKSTVSLTKKIDWPLLLAYILLMLIGWITIYSSAYNPENNNIFNIDFTYGKQFIWIIICLFLGLIILNISSKIFSFFSYIYYFLTLLLLIAVFFLAKEVNGAKAWIDLGFFRLQPSEFAKFTTALALSNYISSLEFNANKIKHLLKATIIIVIPLLLILAQHDMGSSLVFFSFFLLLNRFGLPNWIVYIGFYIIILSVISLVFSYLYISLTLIIIAFIIFMVFRKRKEIKQITVITIIAVLLSSFYSYSIDIVIKKLDSHQRDRINVMLGKGGNDWNVRQSKIAIGAGQIFGKGFLKGTQSKGGFLPAKETDFIFCTFAEEFGFLGSIFIIGLFIFILFRILSLSEKQKSKFAKVYGYSIVCIITMHFIINIGMTLGVVPVIGIPLPALSYGGSSLISFSVMIFLFLRLDSERWIYT